MKKLFLLAIFSVFLVACGNTADSNVTMDSIVQAFEDEAVAVDTSEKPMFQMINAKDGIIFYNGSNPVKIYEYESVDALEEAKETNELLKDWPSNGAFLIETSDQKAIEIFNSVK